MQKRQKVITYHDSLAEKRKSGSKSNRWVGVNLPHNDLKVLDSCTWRWGHGTGRDLVIQDSEILED